MGGAMCLGRVKAGNIDIMSAENGYDVVIVCTSDEKQADFWEKYLTNKAGKVTPTQSLIVAVDEDWAAGGAGNFLGTLYAWRKACEKLKGTRDIATELREGKISIALFHTAGKGTRLAPLPGGENNNKPGVKLPVPGSPSILECVIRQTGAYAKSRPGRLSVWWGDQIFIPDVCAEYVPRFHGDIACALGPMPSKDEWEARGLSSYGCIAAGSDGSVVKQLEKVSFEDATSQLANENVAQVGPSLGSFSLSSALLTALDEGFSAELKAKTTKMDSDPHLWMAMTLKQEDYANLMVKKGEFDQPTAEAHWKRVQDLLEKLAPNRAEWFGAVDVGSDMSWWDYGMLKVFRANAMKLISTGDHAEAKDAELMRQFFGIGEESRVAECTLGTCKVDNISVVSQTVTGSGSIESSAISNCCCEEMNATGATLIGVYAKKITAGKGAVAYNVLDKSEGGLVLAENEVRVGVFKPGKKVPASGGFMSNFRATPTLSDGAFEYFEMKSDVELTDGGKVFKKTVHDNKYSFQEVYDMNQGVDVTACGVNAQEQKDAFKTTLKVAAAANL